MQEKQIHMNDLVELKEKIIAQCNKAKARGFKILQRITFSEQDKRCCALGAFILNDLSDYKSYSFYDVGRRLGLTDSQSEAITHGFDNAPICNQLFSTMPYYDLGVEIRLQVLDE